MNDLNSILAHIERLKERHAHEAAKLNTVKRAMQIMKKTVPVWHYARLQYCTPGKRNQLSAWARLRNQQKGIGQKIERIERDLAEANFAVVTLINSQNKLQQERHGGDEEAREGMP